MNLIIIISRILTLSLFLLIGTVTIFCLSDLVENVDTKPSSILPAAKEETDNILIGIIEEMPRFPGCEHIEEIHERKSCSQQKMLKYIYQEIKVPVSIKEFGIEGMTVVRFYIDMDGSIKDPEIVRSIDPALDEEILRVVNNMNHLPERWISGRQRGKAVKVFYTLPIKIRLE